MPDNSPTTLNCPSCGAPLEVDGKSALVRCRFCKNMAFVPGIANARTPDPGHALDEIRHLAESGNLLEAIKQYRALYGVGLKESKDAVEALAAGKVAEFRISSGPLSAEDTSRILEEVKELLRQGNKIESIKRYREVNDVSLTQAREVIDQIEAALTGIPVPPRPEITGQPSYPAQMSRPTQSSKAGRLGCVITGVIMAFVGGIIIFAMAQPGGPLTNMLIANGPAILVPSSPGVPDVAAVFYNVNDETYLVGMLEGDNGKLTWQAEALSGDSYFDGLVQDEGMLYAASDANLLAYRKSDGSLVWQTLMPDSLNYSDQNLLVNSGRVLVSTVDQSIQAYNASTGERVWERRLSGYDRSLRIMDGSLVVVDYIDDSYNYSLIFIDPATGAEQRILTPTCVYDEYTSINLDPDSALLYEADNNSLTFITDNYNGCIQRLNFASGEPVWQYVPEDSFSMSSYGIHPLLTENRIYFEIGHQLLSADKTSGNVQTLLLNEDYEFLPLAVSGDTLLVRARRTRGTEKFELWGVDAASGGQLWQMDMGSAKPVDPPNEMSGLVDEDQSGWTWHMLAGQLVLIKFQAAPHQLVIQSVNPANGIVSAETIVELKAVSGDFYSIPAILGWDGARMYFELDADIYSLDVNTGEIVFRFQ
jgi:outer membrane protein assembly factor BamB/ribosomal protein L7/L12